MMISLGEFLYPCYDQIQIEEIAGGRRLSIVCVFLSTPSPFHSCVVACFTTCPQMMTPKV